MILVMIPYPSTVGFAIGRLISTFRQMAEQIVGDPQDVHFAYSAIAPDAPPDVNVLEFSHKQAGTADGRLALYIITNKIRIIFALDMRVDAPCLQLARRVGVRMVVSYWGAEMSSIVPWKWPLKRLQVALTRSKPDLFIFESEAMRRLAIWGRGVAESATAIVRTGVDPDRFRPGPSDVHERFGIPAHRKIIVFMGHFHMRKGVEVLMDAARMLSFRDDIHFLILGNKADEADEFLGRGNVTLGGYQDNVPSLLAGCWAGCIPSTGWDSYPMSSLEMQACGLPVFVSDLQGCPETVDHSTGIVTRAGNYRVLAEAITSLVAAPELHHRMRIAARTRIERELTTAHQVKGLVAAVTKAMPRKLRDALANERAHVEANGRHDGLYDEELLQARRWREQ